MVTVEIGSGITIGGAVVFGGEAVPTAQYILAENNDFLQTENGLDLLITEEN
jgi:hypothetical protein